MQCADGVIAQTAIVALACFPSNGDCRDTSSQLYNGSKSPVVTLRKMGYDQVAIIQVLDTCCECDHYNTLVNMYCI